MTSSTSHQRSRWPLYLVVGAAAISAAVMLAAGKWEPAVRFAAVALVALAVRPPRVPILFAATFASFLLLGAWAWAAHWYQQVPQLDAAVHFLLPGSLAAVLHFLLVHARLLPTAPARPAASAGLAPVGSASELRSWAPVVWVTTGGVTAAVVWEFYEWGFEQLAPAGMTVGYTDTIVDLLAGLLGSVTAGAAVLRWSQRHPADPASGRSSGSQPRPVGTVA